MATWRNWLKSLLPWTKEEEAAATPAQAVVGSVTTQRNDSPAAAPLPPSPPPQPKLDLTQLPVSFPLQLLKSWISQNVSFYAWDRIVLRSLPVLRQDRINLAEAMNPTPLTRASRDSLKALLQTLYELYQVAPPATLLQQSEGTNQP